MEELVVKARVNNSADEHIHISWLCVSAASRRFEPVYESIAQMLMSVKVPFVIVITKSFGPEADELRAHIRSIGWIKAPIVNLVAAPKAAGGDILVDAFGLDNLAKVTAELIGPARAAAADYGRYSQHRSQVADAALKSILDSKNFVQFAGTYMAMAGYGHAVLLATPQLVAGRV